MSISYRHTHPLPVPCRPLARLVKYTTLLLLIVCASCSSGGGSGDSDSAVQSGDIITMDGDVISSATNEDDTNIAPNNDDSDIAQQAFSIGYVSDAGLAACSTADLNAWIDFDMRDYYIYYDQVPQLNLAEYTDPSQLIRELRVDPDVFSFVDDQQEQEARQEEGIIFGYGFSFSSDAEGITRFRAVRAGSPIDIAGIRRGDVLLTIDNIPVDDITDEIYDELLFSDGANPAFQVQTENQEPRVINISPAEYRWRTSPLVSVFTTVNGQNIGYLPVDAFYQTTEQELDAGLQMLLDSDIDDLILDMRYNRGGSVRISERLASQIAGPALAGSTFQIRSRNDKYASQSSISEITSEPLSLSLPRVVVLATGSTSSAPETIINGLQSYIDVTVIGSTTAGKPFTSRGIDYCDKTINAMHSIRTNANGVSVQGGIPADCAVEDTWNVERNDPQDALTGAGIAFLQTGACNTQLVADGNQSISPRSRNDTELGQIGYDKFAKSSDQPMEY